MTVQRGFDAMRKWQEICEAAALSQAQAELEGEPSEAAAFCADPSQYEWKHVGRRNILVPRLASRGAGLPSSQLHGEALSRLLRFELQYVWIVDGLLRRGESNLLARRRFYLDSGWAIIFGEGFNRDGGIACSYVLQERQVSVIEFPGRWYPV